LAQQRNLAGPEGKFVGEKQIAQAIETLDGD